METFKIGYFADGPWAHQAFKLLVNDNTIDIRFVVVRTSRYDKVLHQYADEHNVDYIRPSDVNTGSFIKKAKDYNCDLFVSMSFDQIFSKKVFQIPAHNTINCHAGKLPFYRGRSVLNWALINDENEFGITVHFVDEGIDTGDIILQETYEITDEDDYKSLLELAHKECAGLLYRAIKKIQNKDFEPIKQTDIHPTGFYCSKRKPGDEMIDWCSTSRDLFNFIRALSKPGPMATTFLNGEEPVYINKANYIKDAPSYKDIPGTVLSKTENGYFVKTEDSFIEVVDLESQKSIKVGDRFARKT